MRTTTPAVEVHHRLRRRNRRRRPRRRTSTQAPRQLHLLIFGPLDPPATKRRDLNRCATSAGETPRAARLRSSALPGARDDEEKPKFPPRTTATTPRQKLPGKRWHHHASPLQSNPTSSTATLEQTSHLQGTSWGTKGQDGSSTPAKPGPSKQKNSPDPVDRRDTTPPASTMPPEATPGRS